MPHRQVENLSRIIRIPALPPGMSGAAKERWNWPPAFIAYYPTLLLLDKMIPPPVFGYPAPPAGWAAAADPARAGKSHRTFRPKTGPKFSRSAI